VYVKNAPAIFAPAGAAMHFFKIAHRSMRVVLFWAEIYSKCEDIQAVMGDEGMDTYRSRDDLDPDDDYEDDNEDEKDDEKDDEDNEDEEEDTDTDNDTSDSESDNMTLSEIAERNARVRTGQIPLVPRMCG
jgi:hypothetical protein